MGCKSEHGVKSDSEDFGGLVKFEWEVINSQFGVVFELLTVGGEEGDRALFSRQLKVETVKERGQSLEVGLEAGTNLSGVVASSKGAKVVCVANEV